MHKTRVELYSTAVYLPATATEWRRLSRRLSFLDPDPPDAVGYTAFGVHRDRGSAAHLVFWVDPDTVQSAADLADTCAHEATHGAEAIMEWIGHDGGGEPVAYLVGWLAGWLFNATQPAAG